MPRRFKKEQKQPPQVFYKKGVLNNFAKFWRLWHKRASGKGAFL